MADLDRIHPKYEFAQHKGYGTVIHRQRLQEHGPCEQHRRSFAPLRVPG
jgi:ribonuclease HII